MVTLWQANEGFKVLRPSGLEKFQFSSIAPKIFAQFMKFYFFSVMLNYCINLLVVVYDTIKL